MEKFGTTSINKWTPKLQKSQIPSKNTKKKNKIYPNINPPPKNTQKPKILEPPTQKHGPPTQKKQKKQKPKKNTLFNIYLSRPDPNKSMIFLTLDTKE